MKLIAIGILTIATWIPSLAQSDSTRLISIQRWKLEILLNDHFYRLPVADSLIKRQGLQIALFERALSASEDRIRTCVAQRDNRSATVKEMASVAKIQATIHEREKKEAKKRSFKRGFITGSGLGLILLVLVL